MLHVAPLINRDVSRLGTHAGKPFPDRRISRQIEPAFPGNVGVGVEGYVRDAVALIHKIAAAQEVIFHYLQSGMPQGLLLSQ